MSAEDVDRICQNGVLWGVFPDRPASLYFCLVILWGYPLFACLPRVTIPSATAFICYQESEVFMNIYVGNLPFDAGEDDLRQAFAAFGQVSAVSIIKDQFTGQSRGFAFVEMPNNTEGTAAVSRAEWQGTNGPADEGK